MDFSGCERFVTLGHSRVFVGRNIRGRYHAASGTGEAVMIDSTRSHHAHMWCTHGVHHVHTHGVPSGLIP